MALTFQSKIVNNRGEHLRVVNDGWANPVTGHRTSRDKTSANEIKPVAPSTDYQRFEDIYHGDDLGGRIVDELVSDMVRKWIRLNVTMRDDADADDNVQAASDMVQALDDIKARARVKDALKWAQVFGGSIIFIGADDGGGDDPESMAQPLRENAIRSIRFLEVFDRWDVDIETEYSDPMSPKFGQPETYRLRTISSTRGGAVQPGMVIHETRTVRFDGVRVNRRRLQRNSGWHDSIYIRIEETLGDFGISWAGAAHLLADFAPAVFTSPGLAQSMAMDGDGNIINRMTTMDICRSTVRMIPIDEGEKLERQVTPLSGMPDTLAMFILRLCAAAKMPVTKLFGQSPSGLNSTAEGDLSFWYDRVEGQQEEDVRDPLEYIVKLLWLAKDGPTGGVEPKSWALDFESLWQMSQQEEALARKTQAETDAVYIDTGVLTNEEVARSRFGGDRYSFETQLDEDMRAEDDEPEPEPPAVPVGIGNASTVLPADQPPIGSTSINVPPDPGPAA